LSAALGGTNRAPDGCSLNGKRRILMARGSKAKYTNKQKRRARRIEKSYERRGIGRREAARRAWATENKETGGGKKSGLSRWLS
jgi:hypothetical protein